MPEPGSRRGVVVANPGSMRWMRPMATSLAQAGLLRAYLTSIKGTKRTVEATARLPGPLSRVSRELSLRPVPPAVPEDDVERVGTLTQLVDVAVHRSRLGQRPRDYANLGAAIAFDRGVRRLLLRGDTVLISLNGASVSSIGRAHELGIACLLDSPTAHHDYAQRLLSDEARRVPRWAGTLQLHTVTPRMRARLDAELASADRIIVLSSFQRRSFVESGVPEEKLVTIPLGVELDMFRPASARGGDGFRVLFAGQLTQRKGLSYLVEGFRLAGIAESELVLLGTVVGTSEPWASTPGLRHVPSVPFFELPQHYREADAFVLPSLIEGFPQTALQAMASGVPVIVSENTFGEDVIRDGVDGYVVPIRDAGAIAERLRHLADHPAERVRMGEAGRRRAEDFSWWRYGSEVVSAVHDMLAGRT